MATPERYVIETNVLISFLLFYASVPGQAVTKAWRTGVLLRSDSTLSELARVLERPKFDRYLTRYERAIFLQRFIPDTVPANAPPRDPGEPRREKRRVPGPRRSRPSHVHHHGRSRFARLAPVSPDAHRHPAQFIEPAGRNRVAFARGRPFLAGDSVAA